MFQEKDETINNLQDGFKKTEDESSKHSLLADELQSKCDNYISNISALENQVCIL